jgi:hypothetical protein
MPTSLPVSRVPNIIIPITNHKYPLRVLTIIIIADDPRDTPLITARPHTIPPRTSLSLHLHLLLYVSHSILTIQ